MNVYSKRGAVCTSRIASGMEAYIFAFDPAAAAYIVEPDDEFDGCVQIDLPVAPDAVLGAMFQELMRRFPPADMVYPSFDTRVPAPGGATWVHTPEMLRAAAWITNAIARDRPAVARFSFAFETAAETWALARALAGRVQTLEVACAEDTAVPADVWARLPELACVEIARVVRGEIRVLEPPRVFRRGALLQQHARRAEKSEWAAKTNPGMNWYQFGFDRAEPGYTISAGDGDWVQIDLDPAMTVFALRCMMRRLLRVAPPADEVFLNFPVWQNTPDARRAVVEITNMLAGSLQVSVSAYLPCATAEEMWELVRALHDGVHAIDVACEQPVDDVGGLWADRPRLEELVVVPAKDGKCAGPRRVFRRNEAE